MFLIPISLMGLTHLLHYLFMVHAVFVMMLFLNQLLHSVMVLVRQ